MAQFIREIRKRIILLAVGIICLAILAGTIYFFFQVVVMSLVLPNPAPGGRKGALVGLVQLLLFFVLAAICVGILAGTWMLWRWTWETLVEDPKMKAWAERQQARAASEERLRAQLDRQGLRLKSRDNPHPSHTGPGYIIIDMTRNGRVVAGQTPFPYSLTFEQVDEWVQQNAREDARWGGGEHDRT